MFMIFQNHDYENLKCRILEYRGLAITNVAVLALKIPMSKRVSYNFVV